MGKVKGRVITQEDDRKLMREFETFLKEDESKSLTEADLTPDDFECNCSMCMMGWSAGPA